MYTDCSISRPSTVADQVEFIDSMASLDWKRHSNWKTFAIEEMYRPRHTTEMNDTTSWQLRFKSFTRRAVTISLCNVTTSHVEIDIACHGLKCVALKARRSRDERATPTPTVLDFDFANERPEYAQSQYFFDTFVNASDTPWTHEPKTERMQSPIESNFVHPDNPYTLTQRTGDVRQWLGEDIWPIGDVLFSQRFSQLLNTWWIANVAPSAVTGDFRTDKVDNGDEMGVDLYQYQTTPGISVPDVLVLRCHRGWLAVLVIASSTMLLAGAAAAIFGTLRRGPEILGYSTGMLRDSPYVDATHLPSTDDAVVHARRLRNVKIVLGDAKSESAVGRIAVGSTGSVRALNSLPRDRLHG